MSYLFENKYKMTRPLDIEDRIGCSRFGLWPTALFVPPPTSPPLWEIRCFLHCQEKLPLVKFWPAFITNAPCVFPHLEFTELLSFSYISCVLWGACFLYLLSEPELALMLPQFLFLNDCNGRPSPVIKRAAAFLYTLLFSSSPYKSYTTHTRLTHFLRRRRSSHDTHTS